MAKRARALRIGTAAKVIGSDERRGTAAQRGYGHKWRRESKAWLDKHPFCVACDSAGRVRLASLVDHIVPHRGNMKLFWDRKNWQSLCGTCHGEKTGRGE